MRKENKTLLKRILAAMLSVTLMSGVAVMTPIADFVGTSITASAATYTESIEVYQLKEGDYDTSAFKGTVTAYEGRYGVTVEGYEGTSVQKFSRTPYYNQSVTVDFSHGTRLIGQNDYYDAQLDEFFDIYNSDGENITDLFEFSNMRDSYYNYYYYKLKQNLETDIYVFPTGTQFTITLPEGVEIANKDVIVSQEGNVYKIKPTANVTLLSDNLLNIYNNGGTLLVADIKYSAVKNHQFVYEVNVTNQINAKISTASIIRTREELANAKTGDYVMPTETLNINEAGYGWCDVSKYLQALNGYYGGGGIGTALGNYTTATIGNDLIIYLNGSATYVPANPDLCTSSGRYDIETYKGNAWRVDFVGSKYGYDKAIGLKGTYYTEPAEYEFTWADDYSATVTFNGGDPVGAEVTNEFDQTIGNVVFTATVVYNGVTYIETKEADKITVSWQNWNETLLEKDTDVIYGTRASYDSETPTKIDETDTYKYVFSGWSPDVTEVTSDAVYTAQFDKYTIIHDSDVLVNSTVTTPETFVTDPITGDILTEGTDYTLTINDDTITVTGIGNYAGEVTKPFITLSTALSVNVARKKTSTGARVTLVGEWFIPEGAEILESGVARVHVSNTEGITKEYIYEHGIKKSPCVQYRNVKMTFSINLNKTAAQKKICAVTYVKYKIGDKEFTSISDVKFA